MANVAAVNQIVQANGFYKIGTSEAAELSKESMKQVTTIVEIANRIRRHRFGQTLTISDINEALVSRQMKPLIGYHSSYNVYDYVSVGKSRGNEIFAVDEPQLNLRELAKAEVPEYPKQVSFEFHWLAYRGIQPKVPENQTDQQTDFSPSDPSLVAPEQTLLSDQPISFINSHNNISQHLYEFLAESIQAFEEEKRDERTQRMRESIVMNIKTSPAIQPLVPLYLRYIIKEISQSQSPTKIVSLPQLAMTLLSNKLLNLEPYLSHFTSIALTLLLTPPPKNYEQRIYEMGTSFLKSIIHRFQENYKDYHLKIAESLATYLFTDGHPLSTKYGAVLGLEALGHEVIQTYLLPNLPQFFDEFKLYLTDEQASNRKQAIKLKNLLYRVCTIAFHIITGEHDPTSSPSLDPSTAALFREIASFFGYSDFYLFAAAK